MVTNSNGCSKTSSGVTVTSSCKEPADEGITIEENIQLYPHPTNGKFVIELKLGDPVNAEATVQVINIVGQTIFADQVEIQSGLLHQEINLDETATKGINLEIVIANNKIYIGQVVLQ